MTADLNQTTSAAAPAPAPTPSSPPDPEVVERAKRRRFTAEYKLRILDQADRCEPGEIGALLRREGLYSSHLTTWRRQREAGALAALAPHKRGPKAKPEGIALARLRELERENAQLRERLAQAETIIDVQKKSPACWGSA